MNNLPWRMQRLGATTYEIITDDRLLPIAITYGEDSKENSTFITRACNVHSDFITLCENILSHNDANCKKSLINHIKKVLAKAKE